MTFNNWWNNLSRAYQNAFVVFFIDAILLIGAIFKFKPLHVVWDVLANFVPNFYEPILMQLVALVRDVSPGTQVASGVGIVLGTSFASLITIHLVIAFGIGFLFDKLPRRVAWSFVNYLTLIAVIFTTHFFFLYSIIAG